MSKTLVITIGVSGSGKSYAINERFPDAEVISLDSIRESIVPEYSISGPKSPFDYRLTFTTKISALRGLLPQVVQNAEMVLGKNFLRDNWCLDEAIFKYAHAKVRELLSEGKDVVFDATTLTSARWTPLQQIARECGAKTKAMWMRPLEEFKDADDFRAQILRSNEERHALDSLTGKPKGRFTPVQALGPMIQSALKLEDNPPTGFDEVVSVPVKKRS